MPAHQPFAELTRLGPPPAALLVPRQVVLARDPRARGQAANILRHPLGRPNALRHLRPRVGRHQHLVPDLRVVRPGVEVVEPTVPLEADGHHHAHLSTLRPRWARWLRPPVTIIFPNGCRRARRQRPAAKSTPRFLYKVPPTLGVLPSC